MNLHECSLIHWEYIEHIYVVIVVVLTRTMGIENCKLARNMTVFDSRCPWSTSRVARPREVIQTIGEDTEHFSQVNWLGVTILQWSAVEYLERKTAGRREGGVYRQEATYIE